LAGGFVALRPLFRRLLVTDEVRQNSEPIPDHWFSVLDQSVPIARHLGASERAHLLRASRELITTRRWEGCGGLGLNADMQLIVASQACLLTLAFPGEPFPGLREILIYPSTFVPRRVCDPRKWLAGSMPQRPLPALGEASQGVIVLAWEAVIAQAANPHDGHNVVLHEFAHELAYEHDLIPPPPEQSLIPPAYALGLRPLVPTRGTEGERRPGVPNPRLWRRVLEES